MEANQWLLPVVKMTASGSPECFRFFRPGLDVELIAADYKSAAIKVQGSAMPPDVGVHFVAELQQWISLFPFSWQFSYRFGIEVIFLAANDSGEYLRARMIGPPVGLLVPMASLGLLSQRSCVAISCDQDGFNVQTVGNF